VENKSLRVTALAAELLRAVVKPGDTVVDATAGSGQDTLFLANCTGETGRVFAFDIQQAALEQTAVLLKNQGLTAEVRLLHQSHEQLAEVLAAVGVFDQSVKAIMFNLGYLPGGDQKIITTPAATLKALAGALQLLAPGGMITVCLYPGHPGGQPETDAVLNWCETLEWPFVAHHFRTLNRKLPPTLVIIQRTR